MIDTDGKNDDKARLKAEEDRRYCLMKIREQFALGEIDTDRAIKLLKFRQCILIARQHGEHPRVAIVPPEREEAEYRDIEEWLAELVQNHTLNLATLPSGALQRLRWLGSPSSWERVYQALTDAGLIDPSPTAWAEHFITETGEPMDRPRGGSAVNGEAKEPKVKAAVALIRRQE